MHITKGGFIVFLIVAVTFINSCTCYPSEDSLKKKFKYDTLSFFNSSISKFEDGRYVFRNKKSTLVAYGKVSNGKPRGEWHFYFDTIADTNEYLTLCFKNGFPNGMYKRFYDGKLIHKGFYDATAHDTLALEIDDFHHPKYLGIDFFGNYCFKYNSISGNLFPDSVFYSSAGPHCNSFKRETFQINDNTYQVSYQKKKKNTQVSKLYFKKRIIQKIIQYNDTQIVKYYNDFDSLKINKCLEDEYFK